MRHWGWILTLLLCACGGDATFRGSALDRLKGTSPDEPGGQDEDTTITDPGNPDGDVAVPAEGHPEGTDPEEETAGGQSEDAVARGSLNWSWPCAARAPANAQEVVGEGPHTIGGEAVDVIIRGDLCDPEDLPRDIIFVVDVSDSMRGFLNFGNDPLDNGSCGRLDAVRVVAGGLADDSRVAYVTFDGDLEDASADFMTPKEFLDGPATADVFCKVGANTNFKKGLAKAEELLALARATSSREVYFVSDGESGSEATVGRDEAARIRDQALLATMMLKGDETILKEELASQVGGVPLHTKVENAAAMAGAMASLAARDLVGAWVSIDGAAAAALPLDQPAFGLPKMTLDRASYPDGFSFLIEMEDSAGQVHSRTGTLVWD